MERLTLDNAIKYIKEVARKNRINKEKIPSLFLTVLSVVMIVQINTDKLLNGWKN